MRIVCIRLVPFNGVTEALAPVQTFMLYRAIFAENDNIGTCNVR